MTNYLFTYDLDAARRILSGAKKRSGVTLGLAILGLISVGVGLTSVRLIGFTILGVFLVIIFGIAFFIVVNAAKNSKLAFGHMSGRYVAIDDTGLHFEVVSVPWAAVQRISILDRRNELASAGIDYGDRAMMKTTNNFAKSAGQGEIVVSIIVRDGAALAATIADASQRNFVSVPKTSSLPAPLPGQISLTPDVVLSSQVILDLSTALRTETAARGIPMVFNTVVTEFTTANYAAMGIDL